MPVFLTSYYSTPSSFTNISVTVLECSSATPVFYANKKAYEDGYPIICNEGGSRSSKSYSVVQLLIHIALTKPNTRISCVSHSLPHIKRGVYRDFKNILEQWNIWEAPLATQFIQGLQSDNPISSELAVLNSGEGGELFTSREGVIYLTGRDTQNYSSAFLPYDPVTPQVTFSDQAGTALLPFGPSLDVEYNADDIINDLSVSFTGGGSIVVTDTTSISANGKRSATITTNLTGPTGAGSPQDLAANRLEYFRHVIPKVSPVDVGMTRRLTDWQRLLDLELMDCFSVQRTPSVGSALDFRLQVQVIEHQIVQGDWRMRLTGSARYSNWFTADVDFADGDRLAV